MNYDIFCIKRFKATAIVVATALVCLAASGPAAAETALDQSETVQDLTLECSTVAPSAPSKFKLGLELGGNVYDEKTRMSYAGTEYEFKVKYALAPGIRLRYDINSSVALEGSLNYDWYRWQISPELTQAKDSSVHGCRVSFGPCFTFNLLGDKSVKAFIQPTVDWQFIDFDLDLPISNYESGPGVGLAFGFTKGPFKFETGLSWSKHDPEHCLPGTDVTEDFDLGKAFIKTTVYYFDLPF